MSFVYLLVNQVPFGRGATPERCVAGALWLEDIRAQARAVRELGGRLRVAVPLIENLTLQRSGSFELREFSPAQEGFEFVGLPGYRSWREFLRARGAIARALDGAMTGADVVQLDASGHPVPVSVIGWPLARRRGLPRVWMFDGGDFIGQRELAAEQTRGLLRRGYRRLKTRWLQRHCRAAIRDADVVFTHNDATRPHFADVWGPHCHQLDRSYVTADMVVGPEQIAQRTRRLTTNTGPLRFVIASRLIAIKAVDQALRAVEAARREADIRLDIYGDGDEAANLRALAESLGVSDRATFHGVLSYGEPLFARLREAHVMLITNVVPELSRNYMLAMALGLPILTYANPGSDALMRRSGAGVVVPSGDCGALARAMVELAKDPARVAGCIAAGARFASSTTLEACHRRRAELVRECLERRATVPGARAQTAGSGVGHPAA